MKTSLSTHLLRLADVYLIYAESFLSNVNSTTTNADALAAYNTVRARSIQTWIPATSISFMDVFKERRLELAYEGDNWYDFVRLHYFEPQLAISLLSNQERGSYSGLNAYYNNITLPITLNSKNFKTGNRYYTYTLTGGTDNGSYSRKVCVNGLTTSAEGGGPENYETIKAKSTIINGNIKLVLPKYSVVHLIVEKKL